MKNIEQTRQLIEQEYYYMDQEMQMLGLKPNMEKKISPSMHTSDDNDQLLEIDKAGGQTIRHSDEIKLNVANNTLIDAETLCEIIQNNNEIEKSQEITKATDQRSVASDLRKRFTNSYYARRLSTIGLMTTKNVDSFVNINTMRRKYSLDSKLTSVTPSSSRQTPSKNNNTSSFIKSSRRSFNTESKENFDLQQLSCSTIFSQSKAESELISLLQTTKTNSILQQSNKNNNNINLNNNTNNNHATSNSNFTVNSNSSKTGDTILKAMPKLLRIRTATKAPQKEDQQSQQILDITNNANNANTTLDSTSLNNKRRVSFGQIELNQLEIPAVYKYSNVGLEKYRINPNFYLPDGSLKRKFSLPKLNDTIEAIKNCRYLRRNSQELAAQEKMSHSDAVNIFKDLNPSASEIRNFDFVQEDMQSLTTSVSNNNDSCNNSSKSYSEDGSSGET